MREGVASRALSFGESWINGPVGPPDCARDDAVIALSIGFVDSTGIRASNGIPKQLIGAADHSPPVAVSGG